MNRNVRIGRAVTVHLAYGASGRDDRNAYVGAECNVGATTRGGFSGVNPTTDPVTCKKCLKIIEQRAERRAKLAQTDDLTPAQSVTSVALNTTSLTEVTMNRSRYALSFPAINGEVVTQGHADYCQANGHATHTTDGAAHIMCPRCGEKIDGSADLTPAQDTTSVALNTNDMEAPIMKTYADYLATMTVKTLNTVAKSMMLRGYSKLRKAALVDIIARQIGMDETAAYAELPAILNVEDPADAPAIAAIMIETDADSLSTEVDDLYDTLFSAELNESAPVDATVMAEQPIGPVSANTEKQIDHIVDVMGRYFPVKAAQAPAAPVFSSVATPVKAPVVRTVSKALSAPVEELPTLDDLKEAYRNMRKTLNSMGATNAQVRMVARLSKLSAELKAYGIRAQYL